MANPRLDGGRKVHIVDTSTIDTSSIWGLVIEILESFGRFKRAVNHLMVRDMKPLGLGFKQAVMLRFVLKHADCSQADLARQTITDPAATGKVVSELIKRGLLRQKEHPSDKRRWVLSLTPSGLALAGKVSASVDKLAGHMVAPLNAKERKSFVEMLNKIVDSLSQKGNLT